MKKLHGLEAKSFELSEKVEKSRALFLAAADPIHDPCFNLARVARELKALTDDDSVIENLDRFLDDCEQISERYRQAMLPFLRMEALAGSLRWKFHEE